MKIKVSNPYKEREYDVREAWYSLLRTFLNETLLGKTFVKTMDKIEQLYVKAR